MRTTVNLDDELVRRASELAALGGSDPQASSAPRHRRPA